MWHRMANRWELAIQTELPDYEFSNALAIECGDHSIRISADELIDDLRIYITKFDEIDPRGRRVAGYGGANLGRRSSSMPIIGCIGIEQEVSTRVISTKGRNYSLWRTGRAIASKVPSGQYFSQIGVIPSGLEPFGLDADLGRLLLLEQTHGNLSQEGPIFRGMAGAYP